MPNLEDASSLETSPENSYQTIATEARSLRESIEPLTISERRTRIYSLLSQIANFDRKDPVSLKEVTEKFIEFLKSDPLSDQQAGVVARVEELIADWNYDDEGGDPSLPLSSDEVIEVFVGDWQSIQQVFTRTPKRAEAWGKAMGELVAGDKERIVYRGMRLKEGDARDIQQYGVVPKGLFDYRDLASLIQEQLYLFGGSSDLHYLSKRLPFSKAEVLKGTWQGEFTEPFKLGTSVTTGENLRKVTGGFFGDHFLEIKIPENFLIWGKFVEEGAWISGEDEYTVLYFIDPKYITKIYRIKNEPGTTIWHQIQEQKQQDPVA